MKTGITTLRDRIINEILGKQDESFRWGFEEKNARERPEYKYYAPNFRSTLWTLVLLAELKAPVDLPQIEPGMQLISKHFYDPEAGIFRLPGGSHFPIPCLNGNLIYLHSYFEPDQSASLEQTIRFFKEHQRFDDGGFKTPKTYPYCANSSCYGKHSCYWGVTKLLKGISFIPKTQRSREAQQLIEDCIEFVLQHEVCFSSHHKENFLQREIDKLAFPNFYKSDLLEILWLLEREGVHEGRMTRALEVLRSKRKEDGCWELEKAVNTIVSSGEKDSANAFITERASEVLEHYGF
jgi:hypothetical protein